MAGDMAYEHLHRRWLVEAGPPRTPEHDVPRHRRPRRGGTVAALLLVAFGLAGVVALDQQVFGGRQDRLFVEDRPSPGFEVADRPLGTPLPAPRRGGTHEFIALQDDGSTPVAYDPCRPVHYVVRPDNAPEGGARLLRDAVGRVAEVTGLRFVHDGVTGEEADEFREPFQPERYGDRWAPVLISWVSIDEDASLAGAVAGRAGSVPLSVPGSPTVFVTGTVELDAAEFARLLGSPLGTRQARGIVLHELGHLVGLDHVDDPRQLMYPTDAGVLDFAPGDRTGLAALGRGPCAPAL
jgi:Matrixin